MTEEIPNGKKPSIWKLSSETASRPRASSLDGILYPTRKKKLWRKVLRVCLLLGLALTLSVGSTTYVIWQDLPEVGILQDIHLQQPLRIYSSDGALIGVYGSKFRKPITLDNIPDHVADAFIASEDSRFLEHSGVDILGLLRAARSVIMAGRFTQGASTITMQTARNYFLSREKTLFRKVYEILLALKMERELDKQQILELYLNRIFFGHRAYGVEAAALVYYNKSAAELTIAEAAMIAGLPQRPSADNPITNPEASMKRRNDYVLPRMRKLGMIGDGQYREAIQTPETAKLYLERTNTSAYHFAEMVRRFLTNKYSDSFFDSGYNVYTTLDSRYQKFAVNAVQRGLQDYEMRQGYRGSEGNIANYLDEDNSTSIPDLLTTFEKENALPGDLQYAVVMSIGEKTLRLYSNERQVFELGEDGVSTLLKSAKLTIDQMDKIFKNGDIVVVQILDDTVRLAQTTDTEAALYSIDPANGAIKALVGGYSFWNNQFNRATQARRQVGSLFKPFLYSAALANNYNLSTIINDINIVFDDVDLEEDWRPNNYSHRVFGPTLLRNALVHSRNLISIRLLQDLGIAKTHRWMKKFGYTTREQIPRNLSMALGSGTFTLEEISLGFSVFANGGYRIQPWFIERIENVQGEAVFRQEYQVACLPCFQEELRQKPFTEIVQSNEAESNQAKLAEQSGGSGRGGDLSADSSPNQTNVNPSSSDIKDLTVDSTLTEVNLSHFVDEKFFRVGHSDVNVVHQVSDAERVLDPRLALLVSDMMNDVIIRGTAAAAGRALKRNDLYGKTGTTNDFKDAWFSGFHQRLLTTVWVGKDDNRTLGPKEAGSRSALPIWIDYLRPILPELEAREMPIVDGVILRRVNRWTGEMTHADDPDSYFEYFLKENLPKVESRNTDANIRSNTQSEALNEIF